MQLSDLKLRELLLIVKTGDDQAETELISRFDNVIKKVASSYNNIQGYEFDDLFQYGRLKLLSVAKRFDAERSDGFPAYFMRALHNNYKDLARKADTLDEAAITHALPFNSTDDGDGEDDDFLSLDETVASGVLSPEEQLLKDETSDAFYDVLRSLLSEIDFQIILLYIHGLSYKEIAQILGVTEKKVDNSVYNAKKKYLRYRLENLEK